MPGGAEHQSIDQINHLLERGVEVQLIILSDKLNILDKINSQCRIVLINEPTLTYLNRWFFIQFLLKRNEIKKNLKQFSPDAIIAHLPIAHTISRLILKFSSLKTPLYLYHHSTQYSINKINTFPKKLNYQLNVWLSKSVDTGHIFISNAVEKNIKQFFNIKNSTILYNALSERKPKKKFVDEVLQKYKLTGKKYYIIPGRLHPVKGHEFFLKVMKERIIKDNLKIVIAGHGPLKEELLGFAKTHKLTSNIMFTDYVDNMVMLALMQRAELVIIPSLQEGLGNTAIEGLMVGNTVLASDAGGLPEVIIHGSNGYIFENGNEDSLITTFTKITENLKDYKFPKSDQFNDYKERFSIDTQIDKLLAFIYD